MTRTLHAERGIGPNRGIGARRERPRSVSDVVVEQAVAASQRHFSITENIPAKSNPRAPSLRSVIHYVCIVSTPHGHCSAGYLSGKIVSRAGREEGKRSG